MDYRKADLPSLIAAANQTATDAQSTFANVSPAQLNWKPSAERWSVGQCFEHLITSNKGYLPIIDDVLKGRKQSVWERMPPVVPRYYYSFCGFCAFCAFCGMLSCATWRSRESTPRTLRNRVGITLKPRFTTDSSSSRDSYPSIPQRASIGLVRSKNRLS